MQRYIISNKLYLFTSSLDSILFRANEFREVERACNLLQSLQSRRKLSGKVCIRPVIRYLRYLSPYPTTVDGVNLHSTRDNSLSYNLKPGRLVSM